MIQGQLQGKEETYLKKITSAISVRDMTLKCEALSSNLSTTKKKIITSSAR
jgi:hypothetical protein